MNNQIEFHDIFDYYYVPFWKTSFFQYTVLFILFSVLIFVAIKIYLKQRQKKLTPWMWALKELEGFSVENFETKKEYKRFYFKLTRLLKEYFSLRFYWKVLNKTDVEFVSFVEKQKLDLTIVESLQKVLSGAAWVKFANEEVLKTQARKDLELARQIVENTIPEKGSI